MALAAAGDTWGISGPTFIVIYLVIAVVTWVVTTRIRRRLVDPLAGRPVVDLSGHPHDVAFLNGGNDLAVTSALSALYLRGAIAPQRGSVVATGRLDHGADELERAVHAAAAGSVARSRLPSQEPVAAALTAVRLRLTAAGLLISPEQTGRIRRTGLWMLGVAGLGVLRMLAGVAEGKSVGFLLFAIIAVVFVALVQLGRSPRRTRLGDRALKELADRHHALAPAQRPDWRAYGPAAAALGIGIFGVSALWASDPAFADELALQKATATGGADGSSCGSSCGSSSSGDGGGGSSCGGGGCGGGGCGG